MSKEIAKTIYQQLGGNKFRVMTGAKNLVATAAGLNFRLPRANHDGWVNLVAINLTEEDTYQVFCFRQIGVNCNLKKSFDSVYADQLVETLEEATGFRFSL